MLIKRNRIRLRLFRLTLLISLIQVGCDPFIIEPTSSIFDFNPESEYLPLMRELKNNSQKTSLLWFTDVHNNRENLRRILKWYDKYSSSFDDIISLGDQQDSFFTDEFSWWGKEGASKVLQVIGNHDSWISRTKYEAGDYYGTIVKSYGTNAPFYIISQKDVYDKYMFPYISLWDVNQPDSAGMIGKNYYYKDYHHLRLIVLDCMHYGTIDDMDNNKSLQDKWLNDVLTDARSKDIPVMIASHFPPAKATIIPCSYNRVGSTGQYTDRLNSAAYKKVSSFIDEGGEFVCWIAGHGHRDDIGVLQADPRQLLIRCTTANHIRSKDFSREAGKKTQDSFNCISIDPSQNLIYMVKVGADVNEDGERKRIVKYRYDDYIDDGGILYERGLICSY